MRKIIWILVNCNTSREAEGIGRAALKQRLVSCYDIFRRQKAAYFWPPKSGKIETARGAVLVLETLPKNFKGVSSLVKKLHSDKLPFIGLLEIKVAQEYYQWVKGELFHSL